MFNRRLNGDRRDTRNNHAAEVAEVALFREIPVVLKGKAEPGCVSVRIATGINDRVGPEPVAERLGREWRWCKKHRRSAGKSGR